MPVPTLAIIETFNRVNENPMKTPTWSAINGFATLGQISSEHWRAKEAFETGHEDGCFWNGQEYQSPFIGAVLAITQTGLLRFMELLSCLQTPTTAEKSGYMLKLVVGSGTKYTVTIEKMVKGTRSTLATKSEVNVPLLSMIGLLVAGGKLTVWTKETETTGSWTQVAGLEATDSTFTKGFSGIGANGNVGAWDTIEVGESGAHPHTMVTNNQGQTATLRHPEVVRTFKVTQAQVATRPKGQTHTFSLTQAQSILRTAIKGHTPTVSQGSVITRLTNVLKSFLNVASTVVHSAPLSALLDNFNRIAEKPMAAGWGLLGIKTGEVTSEHWKATTTFASGEDAVYWTATEFLNPMIYLNALITKIGVERYYSLYACLSNPGTEVNGYRARLVNTLETPTVEFTLVIEKIVKGIVVATLAELTKVVFPPAEARLIGFTVQGGVLTIWRKTSASIGSWENLLEAKDSTWASGFVGFGEKGNVGTIDEVNASASPTALMTGQVIRAGGNLTTTPQGQTASLARSVGRRLGPKATAYPAVVGTSNSEAFGKEAVAPVVPGGTVAGNLLVLSVIAENDEVVTPTIATPAGWTLLTSGADAESGGQFGAYVFYRTYDGSAMPTIVSSIECSLLMMTMAFTGAAAVAIDSFTAPSESGLTNNFNLPVVTTTTPQTLGVALVLSDWGIVVTPGGAWTGGQHGFEAFGLYTLPFTSPGAQEGTTFTSSSAHSKLSIVFALVPEVLAGVVPQKQSPKLLRTIQRALSTTQGQTVARSVTSARILKVGQGQSPNMARSLARTPKATQGQTLLMGRLITRVLAVAQAQVARLPGSITLSAAQPQSPTRSALVGRMLTSTQPQLASASHSAATTFSVAQSQSAIRITGSARTISTTTGQSASVTRVIGHRLEAAQPQSATRSANVSRAFINNVTQVILKVVSLARSLGVTQPQSPIVGQEKVHMLAAEQGQSPTRAEIVAHTLAVAQPQSPARVASVSRSLAAVVSSSARRIVAVGRALAVTQAQGASQAAVVEHEGHIFTATQAQVVAVARALARRLNATATSSPVVGRSPTRMLSASATSAAAVGRIVGRTLATSTSQSATNTTIQVPGSLTASQVSSVSISSQVARALTTSSASHALVAYNVIEVPLPPPVKMSASTARNASTSSAGAKPRASSLGGDTARSSATSRTSSASVGGDVLTSSAEGL